MHENNQYLIGFSRKVERNIAIFSIIIIICTACLYAVYPINIGKQEPIPFSHRIHNGMKQINCVFCHDTSIYSARAGIPPLQTCMLCHSKIIIDYPPIHNILHASYYNGVPVEWERINTLPDYVNFYHGVHIASGFDCSRCHGDISSMDRVKLRYKFDMGFCIQCHKDEKASIDCFNCHH